MPCQLWSGWSLIRSTSEQPPPRRDGNDRLVHSAADVTCAARDSLGSAFGGSVSPIDLIAHALGECVMQLCDLPRLRH